MAKQKTVERGVTLTFAKPQTQAEIDAFELLEAKHWFGAVLNTRTELIGTWFEAYQKMQDELTKEQTSND